MTDCCTHRASKRPQIFPADSTGSSGSSALLEVTDKRLLVQAFNIPAGVEFALETAVADEHCQLIWSPYITGCVQPTITSCSPFLVLTLPGFYRLLISIEDGVDIEELVVYQKEVSNALPVIDTGMNAHSGSGCCGPSLADILELFAQNNATLRSEMSANTGMSVANGSINVEQSNGSTVSISICEVMTEAQNCT